MTDIHKCTKETDIVVLKTKQDSMVDILNKIDKKIDKLEEKFDNYDKILNEKFETFMSKAEERFASKWIEKAFARGLYFIIGSILTAILNLILKLKS